jgi:gas vesicle protein
MFQSEKSLKDFLLGIAIGGSLGAFMFNTKAGKKVQKDILSRYHMMSQKTHNYLKDGLEKLSGHSAPKSTNKRTTKRTTKSKKKRR